MRAGFTQQWDFTGTCARHALRHSALCFAVTPTERELSSAMGRSHMRTAVFGVDEQAIIRGAQRLGFVAEEIAHRSAKKTRTRIDNHLSLGHPVIVCVEKWDHWAVLAGRGGDDYLCIDSDKKHLARTEPWSTIDVWMANPNEDEPYYALALRPTDSPPVTSLVNQGLSLVEVLNDKRLARQWGRMARWVSLLSGTGSESVANWLEKNRDSIKLSTDKLATLRKVADCYCASVADSLTPAQAAETLAE